MSQLQAYSSLSRSSPRASITGVLQSIAQNPLSVELPTRPKLVKLLLDDLEATISHGSQSRLSKDDVLLALAAVKGLGKVPSEATVLGQSNNLSTLLNFVKKLDQSPDAANEALKCIANTLLLNEGARMTWVSVDVDGGNACVELLQAKSSPETIFLVSRILFLCTASSLSSGTFIRDLVETKRSTSTGSGTIIDIIGAKLDDLLNAILSGTAMAREAMTDLLKFTFNLLLHYPKLVDCEVQTPAAAALVADDKKIMGDFWSPRLDGILPPLLRVFNYLPLVSANPLAPPLTHVIHSLITIPITSSSRTDWFGKRSGSRQSPKTSSPTPGSRDDDSSGSSEPSTSTLPREAKAGPLDRALSSVISAGRRSFSRSSSQRSSNRSADTVQRVCDLFDVSLAHYMPESCDPDDPLVRDLCKRDGETTLDDVMSPLAILLTRFSLADDDAKLRLRQWLIPPDLDRSYPLDGRADTLGRSLRLLGSVYHTRLKDAIGEFLFALCDSDAATMSGYLGYGNVAGFLFHKGVVNPSQASGSAVETASGEPLDPITGTIRREPQELDMTDEEKEREAEKLFVLFDRLERTGAMQASQNPIRQAIEKGKLG